MAALLLDAHRHPEVGTTLGHAALGGASDELNLVIFGSHALQSHPLCVCVCVCVWRGCCPRSSTARHGYQIRGQCLQRP